MIVEPHSLAKTVEVRQRTTTKNEKENISKKRKERKVMKTNREFSSVKVAFKENSNETTNTVKKLLWFNYI